MQRRFKLIRVGVVVSTLACIVLVATLAWRAVDAEVATKYRYWPDWYAEPSSAWTVLLVLTVVIVTCLLLVRSQGGYRSGTPVAIVAGLALVSVVFSMASYWNCHSKGQKPVLLHRIDMDRVVGEGQRIGDPELNGAACPSPVPVALDVARFAAVGVLHHHRPWRRHCACSAIGSTGCGCSFAIGDRDRRHGRRCRVDGDGDRRRQGCVRHAGHPDRQSHRRCVQDMRKLGVGVITVDSVVTTPGSHSRCGTS